MDIAMPDHVNKPLAAPGLISYRCKNRYGWTMIGAKNAADAMREARRSCEVSKPEDLEIWIGDRYANALYYSNLDRAS